MEILKTLAELEQWRKQIATKTIGFVPTMGALHDGHLSLIRASKAQDEQTICSIFVNPTQFNEASDLAKYPRTIAADIELLMSADTNAVFIPTSAEIYPAAGFELPSFQLEHLTNTLEGAHRPGHFDGVVQVVYRLVDLVQPDHLYMGLKDFQQQAIIAEMLRQMESAIELVPCTIRREPDGLAMSSRNRRLSTEQRQLAPKIYDVLRTAKATWQTTESPTEIQANAINQLELAGFEVDYFEIVDAKTLAPIRMFDKSVSAIACVAAWLGDIRLIDNLRLDT
ncbi:MAG: pantoate--beta-alanine ligase [Bacteroidota bacterium]